MPTTGRLVAAVLFAALSWYVSELTKPLFPEGSDQGKMSEVNAAIGFFVGWLVAGSRARGPWSSAVGYGLTAAVAAFFWCLFLQSFAEMIVKSLRKQYDGPVEAVVSVFEIMLEFGTLVATPQIIATILIGGIVAGLITESAARKYP